MEGLDSVSPWSRWESHMAPHTQTRTHTPWSFATTAAYTQRFMALVVIAIDLFFLIFAVMLVSS